MPVHGQYSMLVRHAELAEEQGIKKQNIIIAENGEVIDLTKETISKESKKIPTSCVMVDGLGVGDVGEVVLRDRQNLAEDGMFVIVAIIDKKTGRVKGSPDIISRGFIYLRESKQLLRETRQKTIKTINKLTDSDNVVNWTFVKKELRSKIGHFLYSKTKRRPMVLPVIIEV
jgi:ribonuclease J